MALLDGYLSRARSGAWVTSRCAYGPALLATPRDWRQRARLLSMQGLRRRAPLPRHFRRPAGFRWITDGSASASVPNNRRHDKLPQNRHVLARGRSRRASPRQ